MVLIAARSGVDGPNGEGADGSVPSGSVSNDDVISLPAVAILVGKDFLSFFIDLRLEFRLPSYM